MFNLIMNINEQLTVENEVVKKQMEEMEGRFEKLLEEKYEQKERLTSISGELALAQVGS